jgi:hypothetical protein
MPSQMVKRDPEERGSSPYATSVTIHKLYLQQTLVICRDYIHLHFLSEGIHFPFPSILRLSTSKYITLPGHN